jgi:hypothetical protein
MAQTVTLDAGRANEILQYLFNCRGYKLGTTGEHFTDLPVDRLETILSDLWDDIQKARG